MEEPDPEPKRCSADPQLESSQEEKFSPPAPAPALHNMPATITAHKGNQKFTSSRVIPRSDTVIIKAKSFSGPCGNGRAPTVIPLTSDQIEGILHSFKCPVKTTQDASTQSTLCKTHESKGTEILSPPGVNMASMNEHTPVTGTVMRNSLPTVGGVSRKRCYIEVEVSGNQEKRIKVDLTTPPSPNQTLANGREKSCTNAEADFVNGKPKVKSSSTRALRFLSDGTDTSEPAITVCPAKPVATRPQSIQRITVQVANGQNGEAGSSIIHIPVMNVPQSEHKPSKIILTGIPSSSPSSASAGAPLPQQVSVVNHVMQAAPVSSLLSSTQQLQTVMNTQASSAGKALTALASSTSHPSVHIVHPNPATAPAPVSQPLSVMMPMTFSSQPLIPSNDQSSAAMLAFAGMPSVAAQAQLASSSAFHVVQHTAPSTFKVIPAAPLVSPTHIQVFNVMSAPKVPASSSPFVSCTNSTVLQARATNA